MTEALVTASFQKIFEASPHPCAVLRPNWPFTIVAVNDCYLEVMGVSREAIVGHGLLEVLPNNPDAPSSSSSDDLHSSLERVLADRKPDRMSVQRYVIPARDGEAGFELKYWSPINKPILGPDGAVILVLHLIDDITESVAPEEQASISRSVETQPGSNGQARHAAEVFANTNQAFVVTDAERNIVAVNPGFERITGFTAAEVVGRNPRLQASGEHDTAFYQRMWTALESTGQWQGEIWNRRKSGEVYPAWENISVARDETGAITHYVSVFSDISPIKADEAHMAHSAHYDALTDLPNRLLFTARLDQALSRAERHGEKIGLMFIDLDRFKRINDTLGHAAGDRLLQAVALRLQSCVRREDTVARLSGDEFGVILTDLARAENAAILADKIIRTIAEPVLLDGRRVFISASIGISVFPDDAANATELLGAADAAMYRAKARGRNTYDFYTAELTAGAMERLVLETELRDALTKGELRLLYLPQMELATRRITGIEALLRWRRGYGELLSPNRFLGVAEESGLIDEIGEWAMNEAFRQAAEWLQQGFVGLQIGVNLSGRQILHGHVVETVERLLRAHSLEPERIQLEIEIAEGTLHSVEHSGEVLRRLRALGVQIAVDDFGSGYSSLGQLKHLSIDALKIDRAFVEGIPSDADDRAIASAVISLGHELGLSVIAEGVETNAQLDFLSERGCDEVQGYLVSTPLSAKALSRFLADWPAAPICNQAGPPRSSPAIGRTTLE